MLDMVPDLKDLKARHEGLLGQLAGTPEGDLLLDAFKLLEAHKAALHPLLIWKTMETAHKDGRKILVYQDGEVFCVEWRVDYAIVYPKTAAAQERAKIWCIPESCQDEQGGFYTIDNPTLWAEITLPEEAQKDETTEPFTAVNGQETVRR